jgi:hypothetical protein
LASDGDRLRPQSVGDGIIGAGEPGRRALELTTDTPDGHVGEL